MKEFVNRCHRHLPHLIVRLESAEVDRDVRREILHPTAECFDLIFRIVDPRDNEIVQLHMDAPFEYVPGRIQDIAEVCIAEFLVRVLVEGFDIDAHRADHFAQLPERAVVDQTVGHQNEVRLRSNLRDIHYVLEPDHRFVICEGYDVHLLLPAHLQQFLGTLERRTLLSDRELREGVVLAVAAVHVAADASNGEALGMGFEVVEVHPLDGIYA